MGLRLLLVGMVATLGIDLPTRQELQKWTRSSQTWLSARLDEWNAWVPDCDELCVAAPPAKLADATPDSAAPMSAAKSAEVVSDAEFTAVVDGLIDTFCKADITTGDETALVQLADVTPTPTPTDTPVQPEQATPVVAAAEQTPATTPTFEPLEVGSDLYPGLAYALNFASDGSSEFCSDVPPPANDATAPVAAPELAATPVAPAPDPAPAPAATEPVAEAVLTAPVAEAVVITEAPAAPAAEVPSTRAAESQEADAATISDMLDPAPDADAWAPVAEPVVEPEITEAPAVEPVAPARNHKLAIAFRLTGEAFLAWAKFVEGPAVVSIRP